MRKEYPEQYELTLPPLENCRLLVNTDTNSWRFKAVVGEIPVGEAACTQAGDELTIRSFEIFDSVLIPDGWWSKVWRKVAGDSLQPRSFRRMGLGTAILKFIVGRAREFLATHIVVELATADDSAAQAARDWLSQQGFQRPADGEDELGNKLVLRLVTESEVPDLATDKPRVQQPKTRRASVRQPRRRLRRATVPSGQRRRGDKPHAPPAGGGKFNKESLAKLFRPFSDLINHKVDDTEELLDPTVRERLKASNTVIHHGGDTRVLQYHIWDRDQPSIFHRHHFKYEVQYDPAGTKAGTATTNFCVHFYLNKIRLYHERDAMVARVRRELAQISLPGFKLKETERAFSFHHNFRANTPAELVVEVRRYLLPLLNRVHPMFYRIMDAFNVPMTKTERRAVISGRKKLSFVDRSSPHYGKNQEFRREVPRHLRAAAFQRDKYICQHCERKFAVSGLHADHVTPVARGGLTTLGNLQALCGPCNLRKGKRLEAELREPVSGKAHNQP